MPKLEEAVLLADHGSLPLALEVYEILKEKLPAGLHPFTPNDLYVNRFRDGEVDVQIRTNVRDRNVFVLKSPLGLTHRWDPEAKEGYGRGEAYKQEEQLVARPDLKVDYVPAAWLEELTTINDAAKRASAAKVTNILFYMPYLRKDRKEKPRVPITAKLVAKLLETSGVDHIITLEPHFKQLGGFYEISLDILKSEILFADYFRSKYKSLKEFVVISVDAGGVERAGDFARLLGLPLVICDKRRDPITGKVKVELLRGDVELKGKVAITIDDLVDSGGSLAHGAEDLKEWGVLKTYACCAHQVLSGNAPERLREAGIQLVTTNSIPHQQAYDHIEVISLAHIGAEAIYQLCISGSISESLFDLEKYQLLKRNHEMLLKRKELQEKKE